MPVLENSVWIEVFLRMEPFFPLGTLSPRLLRTFYRGGLFRALLDDMRFFFKVSLRVGAPGMPGVLVPVNLMVSPKEF